ncbi:MAG: YgjV family protein [Clostridia bacterium]|nr:YgjV family protein [Clostridia bacterium]MBO7249831.1 YgjV family protein [Clostridia bacterium]
MNTAALIVGLFAVALYVLSYLQKNRGAILTLGVISRLLYVVQYLLLGAYSGAVLDVVGAGSGVLAQKSERGFVKKHKAAIFIAVNVITVAIGVALFLRSGKILDLLPLAGILFQTDALWLKKEKYIRLVSILGCPCWFTYNIITGAYGSCIGDSLSFLALAISMLRYDILGKKEETK